MEIRNRIGKEEKQRSIKMSKGVGKLIDCMISQLSDKLEDAIYDGYNQVNFSSLISELVEEGLRSNNKIFSINSKSYSPTELVSELTDKVYNSANTGFTIANLTHILTDTLLKILGSRFNLNSEYRQAGLEELLKNEYFIKEVGNAIIEINKKNNMSLFVQEIFEETCECIFDSIPNFDILLFNDSYTYFQVYNGTRKIVNCFIDYMISTGEDSYDEVVKKAKELTITIDIVINKVQNNEAVSKVNK